MPLRSPGGRAQHRPAAPRFRPQLEVLEDRWLPSTLTVLNNLDTGVTGDGSLRGEIAAAQSGDTIVFDPGLKGQTIKLTSGELLLNKSLNIQGLGASQLAISGGGFSRVFDVAAGVQVTLAGLTIRDGFSFDGGGIYNSGTLTVSSCTLSGNSAFGGDFGLGNGGGIYNEGSLSILASTVTGNSCGSVFGGAGIYNRGELTIGSKSVVCNNVYPGMGGFDLWNDGSVKIGSGSKVCVSNVKGHG
jgi:hypothetical protein